MADVPDLVSSAEAATILRTSRTQVNRLARSGAITPVVSGSGRTGARFYKRAEIAELARRRKAADMARWEDPAPAPV